MSRTIVVFVLVLGVTGFAYGFGMESFGNKELSEANYGDWPRVMPLINCQNRVYRRWVNGDESFYYQGDTAELNIALRNFALITADRLTVVLRPGPGETHSFRKEKTIPFNWHLHLLGGISRHMSTLHFGNAIWDPNPTLFVYVGDGINLDKIQIPEGVEVLELKDLQERYSKCLKSSDKSVRGWSCGHIARLNPYNVESMRIILAKLEDDDEWVKLNAVGALANYEEFAAEIIEELEAMTTSDEKVQKRIKQSIDHLQESKPDPSERDEFLKLLNSIHWHVVTRMDN